MQTCFNRHGVVIFFMVGVLVGSGLYARRCEAGASPPRKGPCPSHLEADRSGEENLEPSANVVVTESIGTAWPLACGYLVTNNHVVSGAESITLIDQTGRGFHAWPVLLDELHDIAFLEVADAQDLPPALPLANSRSAIDTRVFTVGFPAEGMSTQGPKRSQGRICGLNGTREDDASYRTTVPVRHGNSGGPLMNLSGEVVGVVRSMLAYQDKGSNRTYILENASCAVKAAAVKALLEHLPEKTKTRRTLAKPSGSEEALYHAVAHSVLQVVARRYENEAAE
ncbi:S1C family serine protease [Desulfosarcina sp.]|uniref:S1C family serine protease n=1 Tax=Desulfosarcina sp. TaxID=2027861 RepID=UPI00356A0E3F